MTSRKFEWFLAIKAQMILLSKSGQKTLKVELIHGKIYNTRQEAKTAIFEYIEGFYNWQRRLTHTSAISALSSSRNRPMPLN